MQKILTKDCVSCSLFHINDDQSMSCVWGKSKKRKYLNDKRIRKTCNLITRNE